MKASQADRILLGCAMAGFSVLSLSFWLIPLEALGILPGLLFWIGLAAGAASLIFLEIRRRSFFASYRVNRKKMQKPRCGLLTFGSNPEARVADAAMLISIPATLLVMLITHGIGYGCYLCIAVATLAVSLHSIFNGRIYFHVKNQKKIRHVLEKKKASIMGKGEGKNE